MKKLLALSLLTTLAIWSITFAKEITLDNLKEIQKSRDTEFAPYKTKAEQTDPTLRQKYWEEVFNELYVSYSKELQATIGFQNISLCKIYSNYELYRRFYLWDAAWKEFAIIKWTYKPDGADWIDTPETCIAWGSYNSQSNTSNTNNNQNNNSNTSSTSSQSAWNSSNEYSRISIDPSWLRFYSDIESKTVDEVKKLIKDYNNRKAPITDLQSKIQTLILTVVNTWINESIVANIQNYFNSQFDRFQNGSITIDELQSKIANSVSYLDITNSLTSEAAKNLTAFYNEQFVKYKNNQISLTTLKTEILNKTSSFKSQTLNQDVSSNIKYLTSWISRDSVFYFVESKINDSRDYIKDGLSRLYVKKIESLKELYKSQILDYQSGKITANELKKVIDNINTFVDVFWSYLAKDSSYSVISQFNSGLSDHIKFELTRIFSEQIQAFEQNDKTLEETQKQVQQKLSNLVQLYSGTNVFYITWELENHLQNIIQEKYLNIANTQKFYNLETIFSGYSIGNGINWATDDWCPICWGVQIWSESVSTVESKLKNLEEKIYSSSNPAANKALEKSIKAVLVSITSKWQSLKSIKKDAYIESIREKLSAKKLDIHLVSANEKKSALLVAILDYIDQNLTYVEDAYCEKRSGDAFNTVNCTIKTNFEGPYFYVKQELDKRWMQNGLDD